MKPSRDITLLESPFRERLSQFLAHMEEIDPMAMHDGLRTQELQDYYVSIGASKTSESNHLHGNAADLHFINAPHFPEPGHPRWLRAAEIASSFGIDNGGILWDWDWNHFQLAEDEIDLQEILINNKVIWRLANDIVKDIYNADFGYAQKKLAKIKQFAHNSNEVLRSAGVEDSPEVDEHSNTIFLKNIQNGNDNLGIG